MGSGQGFFESDEKYRDRMAQEANERVIEEAGGDAPSQGLFESHEKYRDRIAQEANEQVIAKASGDAPSQGLLENDEKYRSRIAQEANEQKIERASGDTPSQGLIESDTAYDTRVRKEANEAVVKGGTGAAPKQGLFEGDHDYRSRIAHEANVAAARGQTRQPNMDIDSCDSACRDGGSGEGGGGGAESGGGESGTGSLLAVSVFMVGLVVVALVGLVAVAVIFGSALRPARPSSVGAPTIKQSSPNISSVLTEDFDSSSQGASAGIHYVTTPTGQGATFRRADGSHIEYSFEHGFPREGTLEWRIFVTNGYRYADWKLDASSSDALVFTTVGPDTWYPGCAWLTLRKDGSIVFSMADSVGGQTPLRSLVAKATTFSFNEWHTVGISFGSQGRSINVDGSIVAHDALGLHLAVGGTPSAQTGAPTIGEMTSRFWPKHQHDGGFEGVVDTFRASSKQEDWNVCRAPGS